ncbi:MAG: hypothetical protein OWS74_05580, partial [Firmicutes bacterium]|nr:hypothetical protein [Bacillota bacterium]
MVHIELWDDRLRVRLPKEDEIAAMQNSFEVMYEHVDRVAAGSVPAAWYKGLRLGLGRNGIKIAGKFVTHDGAVFLDFRDPTACLLLEVH